MKEEEMERNCIPFLNAVSNEQLEANRRDSILTPFIHSWDNYEWGKDEKNCAPYICKCGDEFETHDALMKHTAKLNPTMKPEDLGRAGAGIERAAHEKTLELLRRAKYLLLKSHDYSLPETQRLLADICEQCPVLNDDN